MQRTIAWIGILIFWLSNLSANSDAQERYQTENVVIAIMDGTSWDVSYGDPEHRFISRLWNELRPQGTLYTNFYNDDVTITKAGHSTITTGTWQKMRNRGPRCTLFDYMADEQGLTREKAWVIFGKGPYSYDPTTSFPGYLDKLLSPIPSCAKTRPFRNRLQISSLDALGIRAESRAFRANRLRHIPLRRARLLQHPARPALGNTQLAAHPQHRFTAPGRTQ